MWTMPTFIGGETELTAEMLNTVLDYVRRQGSLVPSPEIAVTQTPEGWVIRLASPLGLWARLTDHSGVRYAWEEVDLSPQGNFVAHPSPHSGSTETLWAEESNGLECPVGTVVWLDPSADFKGESYSFQAPLVLSKQSRETFWGQIVGVKDGEYGFLEVWHNGSEFVQVAGGRQINAGGLGCAIEANGSLTVPVDAIVLMFDYISEREGRIANRVVFKYGAATPPRYAKLTGRTQGNAYTIDLAGATSGVWVAVVDDVTGGQTTKITIPVDADAQAIQDAMNKDTALGAGQVRVSGTSPVTVEFLDRLGGSRDVTLTIDGSSLTYPEDSTTEATATHVQYTNDAGDLVDLPGRDDPYTDGLGAYGWIEMEFDPVALAFRPMSGGGNSDWPYGAANEVSGQTRVPPGAIVRIYPGASVTLSDGSGGTVTDQRVAFQYQGEIGQWAIIGTAGRWVVDLGKPTAGMWALNWDDNGKNAAAVHRDGYVTIPGTTTGTSVQINWLQVVPTRKLVGSSWTTQNITAAGPIIPLPASASSVQAALEATYPMLAGNITVTGALGATATTVTTTDSCGVQTVVSTDPPVLKIQFTGDLSQCPNVLGFTYKTFPSGSTSTANYVSGLGTRYLFNYNQLLSAFAYQAGVQGSTFQGITTADWGSMLARPVGRPRYGSDLGNDATSDGPFTIDACGYDGESDLPTVTIASWLAYGDQGTDEGDSSIGDALPTPKDAKKAHIGGGAYYSCPIFTAPDTFGTPAPVSIETRVSTLAVVEANGREGVKPRTAVRLWTSGRKDFAPKGFDPLRERWVFVAPSEGFWASIRQNLGGGEYGVTPFLTGYSRLRYVSPKEANLNPSVPVGTIVWVEPTAGSDGEKFTFQSALGERIVTVIYAGPTGSIADEPRANGYVYVYSFNTVTQLPVINTAAMQRCVIVNPDSRPLRVGAGYAGRYDGQQSSSTPGVYLPVYRIDTATWGPASAGKVGECANGDQVLGGGSKTVKDNTIVWGTKPLSWTPTGETMPAGAIWQSKTISTTEVFHGSESLTGKKWGFRQIGTTSTWGFIVGPDQGLKVIAAVSPADAVLTTNVSHFQNFNAFTAFSSLPYIAVFDSSGNMEIMRVTLACRGPVVGGDETTYCHVERAKYGTTALSFAVNDPIGVTTLGLGYVADTIKTRFWTNQDVFAVDGTPGGTGSFTMTDPRVDHNITLSFAGGLQVGSVSGARPWLGGNTSGGWARALPTSPVTFQTVTATNGLITSVT